MNEKEIRLRYVRGLERFVGSNIAYLKDPDFKFSGLLKRIERTFKVLEKIESIRLNATYPIAVENYANLILTALECEKEDEKELKERLLKEANLLHKEKNKNSYKKDKHKKKSFNDGY